MTASFQEISEEARPYPMLVDVETALVLFAAAFYGHNDAVHFARRGMHAHCVDIDAEKLTAMRDVYPDGWFFTAVDAWEFAERAAREGVKWDVVSADTFTGDAMRRSLDSLDLWCSLAHKYVTATYVHGEEYAVPEGWDSYLFPRSSNADWLVLHRC